MQFPTGNKVLESLRVAGILSVLALFLLVSSGWVVHVHYCPVSTDRIVSLNGPQECEDDMHVQRSSCCEKEAPSCDEPAPSKEDDCCEDIVIAFDLESPFSFTPSPTFKAPVLMPVMLPVELLANALDHPSGRLELQERPPPEQRRSLDRLTRLQVFRT